MKLVILAVTRMEENRICIAGINEEGKWIRPVKGYPDHFEEKDLFDKEGMIIYKNFNVVDVPLIKRLEKDPHFEDWQIDEEKEAVIIEELPEEKREEFLTEHTENNLFEGKEGEPIRRILAKANKSLILIGPVRIRCVVLRKDKTPKILYELPGFNIESRYTPCTDFKFRALSKKILKEQEHLTLSFNQLKEIIKTDKIFLALGLTRLWKDEYWDMVIGFHTIPDYQAEINYRDL